MGDKQGDGGDDEGQLRALADAVDEACRPAARRPRPLSALRDTLDATDTRPTAAEIIARVRARRAPGHHPEAPSAET
ncbi:hypothetical protein [Actinomycetospora soli]|uniref:hypothetical protein n=1 Tax=Actinomycetospora soli TaxID=2893887 RepID=UPI001E5B3A03|nr:hypothetical protein [Actinomycetospora soli]MCD2191013.1 hypothetical protein [Actinomycetospora soli]